MAKQRLDCLLVERELVLNREHAQRLIRAGKVLVNETVADKPGHKFEWDVKLRINAKESPFVGRGGLKLESALSQFNLDVSGFIVADLGASTGGFTDCLLKHGAAKVYAIDVGYGQLAMPLQNDSRVIVMDRTNCRFLTDDDLGEKVDLVVADLSFISLRTVFPAMQRILKEEGETIVLIKPQFEIGKGRVGKKGIVRKIEDHMEVINECRMFYIHNGWRMKGLIASPIQGKEGNSEFLAYLSTKTDAENITLEMVESIIRKAHDI